MARLPWPQYFMNITQLVAQRSTCTRRQVGAIAVKNKRILATGYNGAPRNMTDCLEKGCLRDKLNIPSGKNHELCIGLHAEQNVLVQSSIHGVSLEGAVIYCTHQPCLICTKLLINCGITEVYYLHPYPDSLAEEMFAEAGIPLQQLQMPTNIPLIQESL